MKVTVYRHQEYQKFIVTVDNGFSCTEYVLYDMSVSELAEFIRVITTED
jgi:hypothetical protein